MEQRLVTTGILDECAVHCVMTNGILVNVCRHTHFGSVAEQENGFHQRAGRTAQVSFIKSG